MNIYKTEQGMKYIPLIVLMSFAIMNYNAKGYIIAILTLLYLLLYRKTFICIDKKLVHLFLFGFTYIAFYYCNYNKVELSNLAYFIAIFPIFYLGGKGLANNSPQNIDKIIFIMSLSIAAIPIISILLDISKVGFLVLERDLPIIGWGATPISATSIASLIIVLCSYLTYIFSSTNNRKKYIYTAFGILAFICVIRIQSRTSIVCIALLFIINIYLNKKHIFKHKFSYTVIFIILITGIGYAINNYSDQIAIIDRFQEDDVATANGRTERHSETIIKILESPLGGNKHLTFAHNLFLDCARVSGIVPLVLLIIFTIKHFLTVFNILKKKQVPNIIKYNITLISMLLFVYFNTEPILEGVSMLFAYFCFIAGVASKIEAQYRNKQ